MADFTNLSFETEDPGSPGSPLDWAWTRVVPLVYATHPVASGHVSRFEAFEFQWGADPFIDELVVPATAQTSFPHPIETFDRGWRLPNTPPPDMSHPGNETAIFELDAALAAEYGTPPHTFDGFEVGWLNDTYETSFVGGDLTAGTTDTFEAGWLNDTYETSFTNPDLEAALFVEGSFSVEDFETFRAPIHVTADLNFSQFTSVGAHGFSNGESLTLAADDTTNGGRLPAGLDPGLTYHALVSGFNTLNISLSPFGPAVSFTDNGIGPLSILADPGLFWTLTDVGV